MIQQVVFDEFESAWLADVLAGEPTSVEKGRRFAHKITSQWLEIDEGSEDTIFCDGSGDGGIDIAVLERAEATSTEDSPAGDTWYLVQSKYGTAFAGDGTILSEAVKVLDTLTGARKNLSSLAAGLVEKLTNFRAMAGEQDRIVLVYATVDALNETEKLRLNDVRNLGRSRLGTMFDVAAVSLRTIYEGLTEEEELAARRQLTVPLAGHLASAGDELLVGSVKLTDLYEFLKAYRTRSGNNLDQLYEKNVRRFLGGRVKVNRGMQETLRNEPERFGLFNNGITIVVSDFKPTGSGSYDLIEPFVVNGCQTTRTIWDVASKFLDAGGTGKSEAISAWKARADRGCVVTKVAKVGGDGESLLQSITKFTNSQNAVREKDFVALNTGFKSWQKALAERHGVYLEVQRGGWDSQIAYQKQNPTSKQFKESANSLDLIKAYGAGWLSEPGLAFGKNPPFLPGGVVFERLMTTNEGEAAFGPDDLFAAYLLKRAGEEKEFGRGGPITRRQTKFVFYFVAIHLLTDVLQSVNQKPTSRDKTDAVIKLLSGKTEAGGQWIDNATAAVDTYMNPNDDMSFAKEEKLTQELNLDVNRFLKWEELGRSLDKTEKLKQLLYFQRQFMKQRNGGAPSAFELISQQMKVSTKP